VSGKIKKSRPGDLTLIFPWRGAICISVVLWSIGVMEKPNDRTPGIPFYFFTHFLCKQ